MHLRLRPSQQDPSKKLVFLVRADNQEVPDPVSQKRWDDEQKAQKENFSPADNPKSSYFIQRLPKTVLFIEASPNFVIEFMDSGCKFIFMIFNGVAQWFFENTCNNINRQRKAYSPLPPGSKSYKHKFFSEELISVTKSTVNNLASLWEGRYDSGWVCDDESGHQHYLVKVCLTLNMDQQIPDVQDAKHTMHMVCGSAKLENLFRVLCRHKLSDQFSLTQLFWESQDAHLGTSPEPGMSFTYLTARIRQILVGDMGWNVGEGRLVWVFPLPCEVADCTE